MLEEIFKTEGQCIRVYMGVEISQDPFEKNVAVTLLNPIPIKALVRDLIASQVTWKMPGIETAKAKEIIVEKRHRTLLEKSHKIELKENNKCVDFEGWRVMGRMQIREDGDFLRVYLYSKNYD